MLEKDGYKTEGLEKANPDAVVVGDELEAGISEERKRIKAEKKNHGEDHTDIKNKAVQFLPPIFWFVSVSLAVFQYLTDIRATSWETAPLLAFGFEVGVPMSLLLFAYTVYEDPGKIPPAIKSASGVEELMRALDAAAIGSSNDIRDAQGRRLNFNRLCTTTFILKGLRTKYCVRTGACVEEFDHFCGWLNVAIGKGNHRPFIALAFAEALTQLCHLYLLFKVAFYLVIYERMGQWLTEMLLSYPLTVMMMVLQTFTAPGVACLGINQLRLIALNMTTNETLNCHRYEHFWEERSENGGLAKKVFVNPFSKGSVTSNCLDFWWTRRRHEEVPQESTRLRLC
jgi:hypothetical protein